MKGEEQVSLTNMPDALEVKLQELQQLVSEKPDYLSPPDLVRFLRMKPEAVRAWLDSKDCPFPVIVWQREGIRDVSYYGKKLKTTHTGQKRRKVPTLGFYQWYINYMDALHWGELQKR